MVWSKDDPGYRQCAFTVMDNIADPDITFDKSGVCNYYYDYQKAEERDIRKGDVGANELKKIVDRIKEQGKDKKYDCLIGLSGGVDSTYVAWLVKQHGLRPLAVHLDNGWDSELAAMNIENIVRKLGIDLYTLVIDWEEFKDIQLAYLKASVVDIEVASDHAILATMYKLAKDKKIGCIISGTNVATEYIMPPSWLHIKMDYANLKDIHKKYGKIKLKTYPTIDFKKFLYYTGVLKLSPISILNYVDYNKERVKSVISKELNWRDYGGKHYESTFTKFYQAYILPEKFKIDKRKPHLSTLICSNQITKQEALVELAKPIYDSSVLQRDTEYVLKKFSLSPAEFDQIMKMPPRAHREFKTDALLKSKYMRLLKSTQSLRKILK